MKKKILLFIALLSIVIVSPMGVNAETKKEEKQAKINQLQSELKKAETDYAAKEAAINKVMDAVEEKKKSITALNKQIATKKKEIATAEANIKVLEGKIKTKEGVILDNAVMDYTNSDLGMVEMAIDSDNLVQINNQGEYAKIAEGVQQDQITEFQASQQAIAKEKATLETAKKNLEATNKKVVAEKVALENNQKQLETAKAEVDKVIEATKKKLDEEKAAMAAMEAAVKKAQQKHSGAIKSLGVIKTGGGEMAWPVPSKDRTTSPFGYRWGRLHAGVDIGTQGGNDPYVAAQKGVVVYAGWMNGYGNAIDIDHGNGVRTRYGHSSKIFVSVGQTVDKGQHIGNVGNTGRSFGEHLHFEVRINGNPVNPVPYIT